MQYRYGLCSIEPMDEIRQALEQADRHVIESRQRVARQQALVNRLERDGHDSTMAKALLQDFRYSLQLHIAGRATIEAELARSRSDSQGLASTVSGSGFDPDQGPQDGPSRRSADLT